MRSSYNHMKTILNVDGLGMIADAVEWKDGSLYFKMPVDSNTTTYLTQKVGSRVTFHLEYNGDTCDALKSLFATLAVAIPAGMLQVDSFTLQDDDLSEIVFCLSTQS